MGWTMGAGECEGEAGRDGLDGEREGRGEKSVVKSKEAMGRRERGRAAAIATLRRAAIKQATGRGVAAAAPRTVSLSDQGKPLTTEQDTGVA